MPTHRGSPKALKGMGGETLLDSLIDFRVGGPVGTTSTWTIGAPASWDADQDWVEGYRLIRVNFSRRTLAPLCNNPCSLILEVSRILRREVAKGNTPMARSVRDASSNGS